MPGIAALRGLLDLQQAAELKAGARHHLAATGDPRAWPLLALAHAHLDEPADAEAACAHAVASLQALDLDARIDLAGVHCLMQRPAAAADLLEAALAAAPDHALALARLGWCRMAGARLDEARQLYERAARIAPARLPPWSALARLCLKAGDHAGAQRAVDGGMAALQALGDRLDAAAGQRFAAQFRTLQLEAWIAAGATAQAEHWIDRQRTVLPEAQWVDAVQACAAALAGQDRHDAAGDMLREAMRHRPLNLQLVSQLAELAQVRGRTLHAIHLLRKAIRIAEERREPAVAFWARLSALSLPHDEPQARDAARRAMDLVEQLARQDATPPPLLRQLRLMAKTALAQVESQQQHFAEAEALFGEVLAEDPHFLPALQGLGQQQMQRGRIGEAVALFEQVARIDPALGHSELIRAGRIPGDEASLARLEQAARQPSLEGRVRTGLLFQLASARDRRGDHDKAFALAAEANQAAGKWLRYDPQAHRDRCARIRHAFCRELFEARRGHGSDSRLPVYVVGMPRSGTTLVEQILAGHSRIFGAGELGIVPQRIQGLERWERLTGSGRHYPDCVDDLSAEVTLGIANGMLAELREFAPGAAHVVDKLPHNFENVGLIKFLFPNARIIALRRDPRDVALSNYFTHYQARHGGMGFAYDLAHIGRQLADHHLLMRHWHEVFPGQILEIDYEEVVDDTEAAARKLLDYVGVDWEPQVLRFDALDRPVKTASVWQVRQPIYASSKAKWRRYQKHLAPLLAGTNARVEWSPIGMVSLPEPGLLHDAAECLAAGQLDAAEYRLRELLHHLPEHAAANYMLGLVCVRKGHLRAGVESMEKGVRRCPWNSHWREDLERARALAHDAGQAAAP